MTIQQGNEEGDKSHMKRINLRVDDLKLAGGGDVLSIMDRVINAVSKTMSKEKDAET